MPAAALPALLAAAAAPLVPLLLLLMCHPLQPRPKKRPSWHATASIRVGLVLNKIHDAPECTCA